jgi:hypothetical protein
VIWSEVNTVPVTAGYFQSTVGTKLNNGYDHSSNSYAAHRSASTLFTKVRAVFNSTSSNACKQRIGYVREGGVAVNKIKASSDEQQQQALPLQPNLYLSKFLGCALKTKNSALSIDEITVLPTKTSASVKSLTPAAYVEHLGLATKTANFAQTSYASALMFRRRKYRYAEEQIYRSGQKLRLPMQTVQMPEILRKGAAFFIRKSLKRPTSLVGKQRQMLPPAQI